MKLDCSTRLGNGRVRVHRLARKSHVGAAEVLSHELVHGARLLQRGRWAESISQTCITLSLLWPSSYTETKFSGNCCLHNAKGRTATQLPPRSLYRLKISPQPCKGPTLNFPSTQGSKCWFPCDRKQMPSLASSVLCHETTAGQNP